MAVAENFKVENRVSIALDALDERRKREVGEVISDRSSFLRETKHLSKVRRLPGRASLYSLSGPDGVCIIYKKMDDGIVVMDLMHRQTLHQFLSKDRPSNQGTIKKQRRRRPKTKSRSHQ